MIAPVVKAPSATAGNLPVPVARTTRTGGGFDRHLSTGLVDRLDATHRPKATR
jgi:hypothetical protein